MPLPWEGSIFSIGPEAAAVVGRRAWVGQRPTRCTGLGKTLLGCAEFSYSAGESGEGEDEGGKVVRVVVCGAGQRGQVLGGHEECASGSLPPPVTGRCSVRSSNLMLCCHDEDDGDARP